jgi:hypothetical protein
LLNLPTWNQALHSVGEYAHDVALLHDEELRAIDFDFGPGPLAKQDAVTLFKPMARILPSLPRAPGPSAMTSPFLRLLAAVSGMMIPPKVLVSPVDPAQGDTIVEGTKSHGVMLQGDWTPVSETSRLRISRIRLYCLLTHLHPQVSKSDRDLATSPVRPRSSQRKVRRMKPPSLRQNRPAIEKLHMPVPEGIVADLWEMN